MNRDMFYASFLHGPKSHKYITIFFQKGHSEVLFKKDILKTYAKFTRKHLSRSPITSKVAGLDYISLIGTPMKD